MVRHSARYRLVVLLTAGAACLALAAPGGAAAGPPPSGAPAPIPAPTDREPSPPTGADVAPMAWEPCGGGFECATKRVPLDYDEPDGAKISLALIRHPATNPDQRIGSLLFNPGGPGGSGVDFVRGVTNFMPAELVAKFDIVGFDPRGILQSTPLLCFDSLDDAIDVLPPFAFPLTGREERVQKESDYALAGACDQQGGAIRDHMSTADVARDMDVIRASLGDEQISFVGFSYGSMVGQNYANLFPQRVRVLVIDGVLDPIAWTTGRGYESLTKPVTERLRSAVGAQDTLGQFFEQCDAARDDCAFSGESRARYSHLASELRKEPADLPQGPYTYADLIRDTLGAMYSSSSWPDLAEFLLELEDATATPAEVQTALDALRERLSPTGGGDYPNVVEGFPSVLCSDSINPPRYDSWPRAADRSERRQGYFGRLWLWYSGVCQPWSDSAGQDRYLGPWTSWTDAPVLVVGNYYDPATPYHGAQIAADLLPNSRPLTYAGWGHTAFIGANTCIDRAVTTYLVTQQVPTRGTVCEPEGSPFGPPSPAAEGRTAALIGAGLPLLPPAVRQGIAGP